MGTLGASVLSAVGHPEWIARSEAEYVDKLVALASDLPSLAQTRRTLRAQMRGQLAKSTTALQQLAARDLVRIAPRQGVTVARLSISQVRAIMETIGELEGVCARLAARRVDDELRTQLDAALQQCQDAHRREDFGRMAGVDAADPFKAWVVQGPLELRWRGGLLSLDGPGAPRAHPPTDLCFTLRVDGQPLASATAAAACRCRWKPPTPSWTTPGTSPAVTWAGPARRGSDSEGG